MQNHYAGEAPIVGHLLQLTQYIRKYIPYLQSTSSNHSPKTRHAGLKEGIQKKRLKSLSLNVLTSRREHFSCLRFN
jgi:hypothetical protein